MYYKPERGHTTGKEVRNIHPGGVEGSKFNYYDQYEVVHENDHEEVQYFVTDSKDSAIDIAVMFKGTGRYIAVVQVKATYYVWLDSIDAKICPIGRRVRTINDKTQLEHE